MSEKWEASVLLDATSQEEALIWLSEIRDALLEMSPSPLETRDVRFALRWTDSDEWTQRFGWSDDT